MKKMNLISVAIAILILAACNSTSKSETGTNKSAEPVMDTSNDTPQTQIMTGTFEGTLPAASCEGIKTSLTINADSTYSLKEEYLGEEDGLFETNGVYHLIGKDLIQLITPSSGEKTYYIRVDNGFMLSDSLGTINQGELAEYYILKLR